MSAHRTDGPQVVIAGGGPVGLTLAIDLGLRGIRVLLLEAKEEPLFLPKMERCNARTMEIYRRLGLADAIRAASSPTDASMDIAVVTTMTDEPRVRLPYPTVDEGRAAVARTFDGSLPLEPYQVISQYTLEPLLRRWAEALPTVEMRFGHTVVDFEQDGTSVSVVSRSADGETTTTAADYLVGSDGGRSVVRKKLGFALEGNGSLAERNQIFFRSPDLFDKHPAKPCRMYFFMNRDRTVLTVQDDPTYLRINTGFAGDEAQTVAFVRELLGLDVEVELISVNSWKLHLLVAEHFQRDRVFLCGDALRLVIPTGGLGLNTGIGDASDLAWKLAAALQGWGGPELLGSYEAERRPVALRAVAGSRHAHQGQRAWQDVMRPGIDPDRPEARGVLRAAAQVAATTQRRTHEMVGTELGYIYAGSPVIVEGDELDLPDVPEVYIPTARPGARLPHMWLTDGRALHDLIDRYSFTLLHFGPLEGIDEFQKAFADRGAPLSVLRIDQADLVEVYDAPALLLRPDLHVAWRGEVADADPDAVAGRVTGQVTGQAG
ncbi:FAD-dependent monooxygenase [Dactylosporangium sp. NPDC005555]|uniref:FAD-dependent monooxygenase n=1 Tax=Dactylosporangium sp. NPDC005555 TaxID=3154889 RepID=UPI0033B11A15